MGHHVKHAPSSQGTIARHSADGQPREALMPNGPRIKGPLMLMAFSTALGLCLSVGFTYWAIGHHSHQACTELRILARTGGAVTPYDKAIRGAYEHLYRLRCT